MNTITFLNHIFSQQCQPGDYIVLAVKKGKTWKDVPIRYGPQFKRDLREFLKKYPKEQYDLYWSPMPYSKPRRQIQCSLDTKFLAQDIDEMEDPDTLDPKPSYIWESSPNKYQGLWELDRYIEEKEYTPLNKALAEHIGCDDCFDFAHVYRIPGTLNHKYKNTPAVELPMATRAIYKPAKLRKAVGGVNTRAKDQTATKQPRTAVHSQSLDERKIYAKYQIPKKVRETLALDSLEGVDRSKTIWYVEKALDEAGLTPQEIILLVKNSIFNKYKGRKDEDKRLQRELMKIISGNLEEKEQTTKLKTESYGEMMSSPEEFKGWLVKGFWGRRSHGIVAGMPKCFKSTLVHDLVVSVASGTPFLNKHPVDDPGPVVVVQNENSGYIMKDRTQKVIHQRGLDGWARKKGKHSVRICFPEELPITFINQQGFTLTNEDHRRQVEDIIREVQPVLVVFDPLYLMFEGDLNSSQELNPVLNWLLRLKREYDTSVMLVHHYNKGSGQNNGAPLRGGARMAGSIMLYGWVESAWYLTKTEEQTPAQPQEGNTLTVDFTRTSNEATVMLSREFRMAGTPDDMELHIEMGDIGDDLYEITESAPGATVTSVRTLENDIMEELKKKKLDRNQIRDRVGGSPEQFKRAMDHLVESKKIVLANKGFIIPKRE